MNSTASKVILLSAIALAVAVISTRAQGTPAAPADADRFTLRLGSFLLSSINTKLALSDTAGHGGQELDFRRDLGGRDSLNVFRADGEWRINDHHKIQLSYFDINRSASKVLTASINWGDQTYPVNATVNTRFETIVTKLNYGYTFYRNEDQTQEITGLVGLHITQLKASLSGATTGIAEGANVTAPLPIFGLEWKARLSDHLISHVAYEYFGISLDNKYKGNLSDFQAMLEFQMTKQWSLGAGYNRYTSRATVTSDRALNGDHLKLSTRHNYNGLMLFVSTNF